LPATGLCANLYEKWYARGTDLEENEVAITTKLKGGDPMANRVARVTEIIAASPKSFEDAIQSGFKRASKTLRGITGLRVIEQRVAVENNKVTEYRVRMEVIFLLES
jgi:hypothetical protein